MKKNLTKILIFYYFIMINIYKIPALNEELVYYALVFPLLGLLIYCLKYLINERQSKLTFLIYLHFIIVSIVSIFRIDFNTVLNVLQMFIVVFFFLNKPVSIELKFINKLFYISIILGLIGYYLGLNIYGITPFNGGTLHSRLWRVSLFLNDNLAVSASYSFLVLLMNYLNNKQKSKIFIIILSLYFIILASNKTVIALLIFSMAIIFLYKSGNSWSRKSKYLYILLPIVLIAFLYNIGNLFNATSYYLKINNSAILYLLNIGDHNYNLFSGRDLIWSGHLDIFKENWFFGAGEFTLADHYSDLTIGSESKFTYILARDGIFSFVFFGYFISLVYYAIKNQTLSAYLIICALIIIMFFYGSFSNGYNFGFIIFLATYASELYKTSNISMPKNFEKT